MAKAQTGYSNKYNSRAYDQVKVNAKRTERLPELLDIASERAGISKQKYILEAIHARLERDGISIADLPPVDSAEEPGEGS